MEILALLGLAYVSTVLNTQIISEHEKEAIKKENFFSFPFFKQTSKKQTKQSNIKKKNSKNVNKKVGEKKGEKKDDKKVGKKKERANNYIQYPVKLDNLTEVQLIILEYYVICELFLKTDIDKYKAKYDIYIKLLTDYKKANPITITKYEEPADDNFYKGPDSDFDSDDDF